MQLAFPLKPYHNSPTLQDIYHSATSSSSVKNERETTRKALQMVNSHHQLAFGRSITESATKLCPEEQLQKKPTEAEKKRKQRKLLKRVRDKENESLLNSSMKTVYAESESLSAYKRKRKALCFEISSEPKKDHTKALYCVLEQGKCEVRS